MFPLPSLVDWTTGYSVVTYLLQIKDRHNGNILLDRDGHLIHIDFGFMLSNSPGNMSFEAAPFKLSTEYVEVLGGVNAQPFLEFRRLFREGFEAARKHCDRIITLVELMQKGDFLILSMSAQSRAKRCQIPHCLALQPLESKQPINYGIASSQR